MERKRILVLIVKGSKDVVGQSSRGKVGIISHDYKRSHPDLPEIGQYWIAEIVHENDQYFIFDPIAQEPNGPAKKTE